MKEQAPFPSYHWVNKQRRLMGQSDREVDENTVDISDYELIPTPQGLSKWRKLMGGSHSNIHQFTHDMTVKDRILHPIKIKIWLHTVFMLYFCRCFLQCWWRRPIDATINTCIAFMVDLQYLMSLNLKCFCY
jgi:hypothetical protein